MKYYIFYLFLSISIVFNFSSCSSSKSKTNDKDFLGIWYPKKPNSDNRVRISEKLFISESMSYSQEMEVNENTPKEIIEKTGKWKVKDTLKIVEKESVKNETDIMIILSRQKNGKAQYNSFLFGSTEKKGIRTFFSATNKGFETIEEARSVMYEARFKNLNQDLFFSEEYVETVFPTLKPMTELTKEDYITVVKYVRSFEEDLKQFILKETDNDSEYLAYKMTRMAQNLADKKFYLLGYDPNNLPENDEDYRKKFEGDKDIEELNKIESEIKF